VAASEVLVLQRAADGLLRLQCGGCPDQQQQRQQ
jgi:hypothetical protein